MFSERFDEALVFAHQLHRKQKRKTSGAPYMSHLLGVASLVMDDGGSEDETVAALLHDALEDQSHNYPGGLSELAAEIERRFGVEVLRIVEACTERTSPEERRILDRRERWREHKRQYVEQIVTRDESVRRVSCADSIHNVRSLVRDYGRLGEKLWSKFLTKSGDDQLWAYCALSRALSERDGASGLVSELRRAVDELRQVVRPSF
jgi:GTP pyrophosphokinase